MYLGSDNYLGPTAFLGFSGTPPTPTVDETLIEWLDLVLHGFEGRFTIQRVEGWDDLPDTRADWVQRPGQHGAFDTPVYARERHVIVTGLCVDPEQRDALLHELQASMILTAESHPLRIYRAGRQLSAAARLVRFKTTGDHWAVGGFPWAAEWVCPDPYRYGEQQQQFTTLPEIVGGLRYPLFTDGAVSTGRLQYGPRGSNGRVVLTNEGNADAWPSFEVAGPAPSGFAIQHVESGRRIVSATVVPAGSVLRINTATGSASLDGVDRSGQLTVREWAPVPAGGSATFAFSAPVFSSAALTASVRPTYW